MIVVQRLRCFLKDRLFESAMTGAMAFCSIHMAIWPQTIEFSLFRAMLYVFDSTSLTIFMMLMAAFRLAALIANGNWPRWGPLLRMIGASGGAIVWLQMTVSLVMVSPFINGAPSLSIEIFFWLTLGELYSAHRAALAYRKYREYNNGLL
jgi:hypothetical protein